MQNSFALQNNIKNYLPNTWLSTFIGCIGDVSNGSTPSRKKPEYWNGEILWVSSGEVSNNFIEKTKESITQFGHESCSVSLLPATQFLLQ